MFNLTLLSYQNLRQLARPSSPIRDSISLVSHYNPFAISRKASLTYQIPYKNSYVNRARNAHTYATHPERLRQIIKSKDAHVLCSYFTSKKYVDKVEQAIEQQKSLLDSKHEGAKVTYEHVIDCAQPERKKIKHEEERSLEDEVEEEYRRKPQSLAPRIANSEKRKPHKTTVMSLMLKKKYEDSKKFPILDPATPEVMEKKSAVLRHRTTILPLILKSTKRAKVKEEHYSERDIDRMDMEDSDVKSIDEHVKYAQDPRMAKLASAYSERQSKTLDRKETMSSRGAALSRNMTTISVPVSRLKSSGKKVSKGVKSASSSSLRTSIQSDSVSKGAEDSESRKSFWSILNWTPFGYGAKQVNRVTPSISVNRVFKKDKVDTTVERDEERDEDSVKKAVLINTKSKEADGNVKKKGTVMSKKNKRKSRTKAKKLSPPPGVTTKIFLCSSDVDNIDRLYDKVRTASATRPMQPVEDKKYSTRPKFDINYLVTKDQSPTYKLVADMEKRKMKYILNRFKLVPKKLKHNSLKFVNKKSTGVVDKIVPESDNYSLFVGKARYKLAYV